MLGIHDNDVKITIARLAEVCFCSTRTIHRNLDVTLRREIKLLNKQNEEI
jgi:MarR-like DNA-binding transcriptional regulator SgrR of sgrS sRNA